MINNSDTRSAVINVLFEIAGNTSSLFFSPTEICVHISFPVKCHVHELYQNEFKVQSSEEMMSHNDDDGDDDYDELWTSKLS